jgi:hypothetical protein
MATILLVEMIVYLQVEFSIWDTCIIYSNNSDLKLFVYLLEMGVLSSQLW